MSELEAVRQELSELTEHLSAWTDEPEEWSAQWMMHQSLLQRQADLIHRVSLLQGVSDVEIFLEGDAVHDNAVDAGFVGSFLGRLQTAVSAIIHELMGQEGTRGTFPGAVAAASELQLVATGPGSFMLALEGPRYPMQGELGEQEAPIPPLDEAMSRLMAVVEAAATDIDSGLLRRAIANLGGHRAVARTVELSSLLSQAGTGARFVHRLQEDRQPRETQFSVPVARRLKGALETSETTQETVTLTGVLSGVRWTAQTFELEVDETNEVIAGSVALALRHAVRNAFDRHVEATVIKTTVRSSVEEEESHAYSLIDLRTTGSDPGYRLPDVETSEDVE